LFTSTLTVNVQNLTDYILQRIGVGPYYSNRKDFPALIHRHSHIALTHSAAEHWLDLMEESLESMEDDSVTDKNKGIFLDFLRYTAFYLVAGQELQTNMSQMGAMYV
jgi:truncated hemoglobin YjbI